MTVVDGGGALVIRDRPWFAAAEQCAKVRCRGFCMRRDAPRRGQQRGVYATACAAGGAVCTQTALRLMLGAQYLQQRSAYLYILPFPFTTDDHLPGVATVRGTRCTYEY
eukprot:7281040-Pyramimonas_sp.AAC.1